MNGVDHEKENLLRNNEYKSNRDTLKEGNQMKISLTKIKRNFGKPEYMDRRETHNYKKDDIDEESHIGFNSDRVSRNDSACDAPEASDRSKIKMPFVEFKSNKR